MLQKIALPRYSIPTYALPAYQIAGSLGGGPPASSRLLRLRREMISFAAFLLVLFAEAFQ